MPRCPVCRIAIDLIKYEGVPVYNCGTCGGYWLTGARLDLILARREVVMPDAVQVKMIALAEASDSQTELWCWTCGKAMVREPFKHWNEIQLDRCPKCGGLWLDRGELEKCQIYWEYMQDHPDSEEAQRAEKLGLLNSRWAVRKARLEDKIDRLSDTRIRAQGDTDLLAELFNLDRDLDPGAPGT